MDSILFNEKEGAYEPKYPYLMKHKRIGRVILRTSDDDAVCVFKGNGDVYLGAAAPFWFFNDYEVLPKGSTITLVQDFK